MHLDFCEYFYGWRISSHFVEMLQNLLNLKWVMNYSSRPILGRPQSSVSRNPDGIYLYIYIINVTIKFLWVFLNEIVEQSKGFSNFHRFFFTRTGVGSFDSCNYDPELRAVLELATDSELYELERILFGPRFLFWWHYVLCIFIFLQWYRMLNFFFLGTKL